MVLAPIHESNDCHNPGGSPEGGRFCSEPGAASAAPAAQRSKGTITVFDDSLPEGVEQKIFGKAGGLKQLAESIVAVAPGRFSVRMYQSTRDTVRLIIFSDRLAMDFSFGKQRYFDEKTRPVGERLVATIEGMVFKPEMTKGGIAKGVLAASIAAYEQMGVQRVELEANLDVGGYAWARFGFKADRAETLARKLRSKLRTAALKDEHKQVLTGLLDQHSFDPTLPWKIADAHYDGKKIGKEIMVGIGSAWRGHLDMADKDSRERLKHYLSPPAVK